MFFSAALVQLVKFVDKPFFRVYAVSAEDRLVANLLLGITLGFGAGVSPGPMLVLVITSSLEKGFRAGLRVALAPLASDAPIILISLLVLPALSADWLRPWAS